MKIASTLIGYQQRGGEMSILTATLRIALLSCCAGSALLYSSRTFAAETMGDDQGAALEEVVVTAQRRSERLVDVPMAVVSVPAQAVEKAGVVSIHDIGNVVPGVQINFAGGYTQPTVRGITTLTTGPGFENNIALYVDGFYTPDNVSVNQDLANIASVEVLKGPQGTLWGRNATGGAILIMTKDPSKELTGSFRASYARYDDRSLAAYLSGPITSRLRYSLAAYGRETDGYIARLDRTGARIGNATPIRQASVRAKLQYEAADNLTATASFNYGLSDDIRGQTFLYAQYVPPTVPPPPLRSSGRYNYASNRNTSDLSMTHEGTLKIVYTSPVGVMTSYTGYAYRSLKGAFDFDGSYADITYSESHYGQNTFQQGVDFSVTGVPQLDLIVGASYYRDVLKNKAQRSFANNALQTTFKARLYGEAVAGYVDATYHVTDRLALNVGGRYTREIKEASYSSVRPNGTNTTLPGYGKKTFSAFTPRASLRYEIAPETNIYLSYSKGFRSGGFQPQGASDPALFLPFDPEKIEAYELGIKASRSRWQFSAAVFYYDYRDLQVGITVPNPICSTCGVVNLVLNAPKAEVYGADAEVTARPIARLNIRAGVALLHGRYRDFPNATGNGWNAATGFNVTGQVQNWSNLEMARAPEVSGNLGIDYTFPGVFGGDLNIGANAKYTASFVLSNPSVYGPVAGAGLARKQRYRSGAYTLVNTQATWSDADERYKITLFINNITDERYRMTYNGGAFGDYSMWASPRTYGLRMGYDF